MAPKADDATSKYAPRRRSSALDADDRCRCPTPARDVIAEGVRRLVDYQDAAYARLYLDRLAAIRDADARANADGKLLRETARHLALRMSYEDVIRVAQAKTDPARLARIAAEVQAKPGEPVKVFEFLKPGIEELCSVLPPSLARRMLALSERREWLSALALGHGGQHHVDHRAICASACWRSCGASAHAPIATAKSSARSSAGST